jgi:hypothetical protein
MTRCGVSRRGIAKDTIMELERPIMLSVSLDQQRKQFTASVREETGCLITPDN